MLKLLPAYLCLDVYLYWLRLSTIYSPGHMDTETQRDVQSAVHEWNAAAAVSSTDRAESARSSISSGSWQWPYDRHADIILLQAASLAIYWGAILIAAWVFGATQPQPQLRKAQTNLRVPTAASAAAAAAPLPAHAADQPPLLAVPPALGPDGAGPGPVSPTPLFLSLLLSSFGKFFALLPLIWSEEYAGLLHLASMAIAVFVCASNLRAVRVARGLSMRRAAAIVAVGVLARAGLQAAWRSVDPLMIPYLLF